MLRKISCLLCLFITPAGAGVSLFGEEPRTLFYSDFNEGPAESRPLMEADGGPWRSLNGGHDVVTVVKDTENLFGQGDENQFLSVRDGVNFNLNADLSIPNEVVTLSLDIIGRNTSNDNRWLNVNFLSSLTPARAHVLSFDFINSRIRTANVSYGENDERMRVDTIMNNSAEAIHYDLPGGVTMGLGPGRAAVWVNGENLIMEYAFARENEAFTPISAFRIQADSTATVSFDLNEFAVFEGAHVLAEVGEIVPPPVPPMVEVGEDGRLVYTQDDDGNRIPDFSNAGYMGGGVPIPDVPVKKVLDPAPNDDTARIQNALDEVGALPLDEHGFRGAVLLTAGEYQVSGSLTMNRSGVVLRGEGDGPGGTVLRATGIPRPTADRTLIRIGGAGSTWQEVPDTRRNLIEDYVPVGTRSFLVDDPSPFRAGETVVIHRPSTAEWIAAIGMDSIPERSDGLPVRQWQPGDHDQHYDRVVTSVDGNRITVDAPLVNAFETRFGGGSIYRYTWPGRISQVGVENIRSVSDTSGNTSDENHAWTFIEIRAAQNGWVRNTTAVHYVFGNTRIFEQGKWFTVSDSANLDPVSTIAGSRRYPFYVRGQLNLVKNCFATYSRHDFAIDSRTRGPNVFLNCHSENSYSDSGPHHRWATGTLYDNVHVPGNRIAIQNRLNYGSGHGWAGANDVVWNSSANEVVVQNPPTAQNWAIGVTAPRWPGAFPDYAEEGYWVSHWVPVDPQSLYLKQREDRLADEGAGGLISLVRVSDWPETLDPGETGEFRLGRRGVLDGSVPVKMEIEGAEYLEELGEGETFFLPAGSYAAEYLPLTVRDDAYLHEDGEIVVRFRHGPGYSIVDESEFRIVIPARPWEAWQAEHFSEEELQDPEIAGDEASPAGDGISNLVKFAFDLDPREPAVLDDVLAFSQERGKVRFEFTRRTGDLVSYGLEVSEDLKTWKPVSGEIETEIEPVDDQWERVIVTEGAGVAEKARFFRLRVAR